jgi:hypothetical protein
MPAQEFRRAIPCVALAAQSDHAEWSRTADHSRDVLRDKVQMISRQLGSILELFDDAALLAVVLQIDIPSVVMNPPQTGPRTLRCLRKLEA